jgi:hypothetical protein
MPVVKGTKRHRPHRPPPAVAPLRAIKPMTWNGTLRDHDDCADRIAAVGEQRLVDRVAQHGDRRIAVDVIFGEEDAPRERQLRVVGKASVVAVIPSG